MNAILLRMLIPFLNLIFLVVMNVETHHSLNDGPCPEIPPSNNFNITQFDRQRWYILYRSFRDELHFFKNRKCIEKSFTFDPDIKSLTLENYAICDITNKPIWNKYYGYMGPTAGVVKWLFENSTNSHLPLDTFESRIVDTDYKTYYVSYCCGYSTKTNQHSINVDICSSSKHLSSLDKLQNTVKLFKMYNVNIDFVPIDWSDCRVRCEKL